MDQTTKPSFSSRSNAKRAAEKAIADGTAPSSSLESACHAEARGDGARNVCSALRQLGKDAPGNGLACWARSKRCRAAT